MDEPIRAFKYVQAGPISHPPGQLPPSPKPLLAAAITLLLLLVLLGLRTYSQSNELQALNQPRADTAAVTLNAEAERGGLSSVVEVLRTAPALLELNYLAEDFPRYRAVLREHSGRPIWSGGLHRDPRNGGFTLYLPAGSLPPTACVVELYGVGHRREKRVATYNIAPSRSSIP
jgi:hypothetical protein